MDSARGYASGASHGRLSSQGWPHSPGLHVGTSASTPPLGVIRPSSRHGPTVRGQQRGRQRSNTLQPRHLTFIVDGQWGRGAVYGKFVFLPVYFFEFPVERPPFATLEIAIRIWRCVLKIIASDWPPLSGPPRMLV